MTAPVVHHGDCIEVMRGMADNSVDAIVTDPPYGLGFMGKAWDDLPPGIDWAAECLRVLKPGGHLLAFGGTRTWHRLACAVEDAGFEIRDSIAWLYGSGFPKSLDVSKAIDKANGKHDRDLAPFGAYVRERREAKGWSLRQLDEAMGTNTAASWWEGRKSGVQPPGLDVYRKLKTVLDMAPIYDELIEWLEAEREKIGTAAWSSSANHFVPGEDHTQRVTLDTTAPATDAARQWQGWGTAMKPAFEPVVMARKPLVGTVAANVIAHGTGALNIDGCRIAGDSTVRQNRAEMGYHGGNLAAEYTTGSVAGRWPANVALDEDQAAALDQMSGTTKDGVTSSKAHGFRSEYVGGTGEATPIAAHAGYGGSGGASRFFYVAKAPAKERPSYINADGQKIAHATVKPVTLMQHLVRLVTPPGGTILDPFAGSGTTIEAAMLEGFDVIGIEREADYLPLIQARIDRNTYEAPDDRYGIDSFTLFDTEGETA